MASPRPSPIIMGLAAGVVLATAYTLVRVEPAAKELVAARDQSRTLTLSINTSPPVVDVSPLQDELDALRAERDALVAANAAREARIAPDVEVPALEHQVAALAREAGLRLESQAPGQGSPRARRWTFGGTFQGLWRFVAALEGLPRRVVLRDLKVRAREADRSRPLARRTAEPPLEVEVTVIP